MYPTRKLYDIGAAIVAHDLILQRLEPAMQALRESTRETIILGKRHKDSILYLQEGKKLGYFTTRGENVPDVSAVAVPLSINNESFGLAVAGPSHRIDARIDEIVRDLREAQKSLLDHRIAKLQA